MIMKILNIDKKSIMLDIDKITMNIDIYMWYLIPFLSDKWCTSINRPITLLKSEHKITSQELKMIFIEKLTNGMTFLKKWQKSDKWNRIP
jgi:hypothetical protein